MSTLGQNWGARFAHTGSLARRIPSQRGPQARPTIGLVTAIPEEFAAMRAFVDDTADHATANDPAWYVLGTMPSRDKGVRHNVVLTLLGATANNAAACGCANLLRSYPSVSTVIMVGIAAGMPNLIDKQRHVRLGDIVVPTQGIVDYGHVRAIAGTVELRRSFPLPSSRLTRCADMLKADELRGLRPWEDLLNLSERPELSGYRRPPGSSDVLHDCSGEPVPHPKRNLTGHRKGFPKVHYGMIGSADRSLRDAELRDELVRRYGFLALEMEGSGIANSAFLSNQEWFVVRGISDYGDGHRNGLWRQHASLVAAAYVRALLEKCLSVEPVKARSFRR